MQDAAETEQVEYWERTRTVTRRDIRGRPFGVGFECLARTRYKGAPSMDSVKYIGMNATERSVSLSSLEFKSRTLRQGN